MKWTANKSSRGAPSHHLITISIPTAPARVFCNSIASPVPHVVKCMQTTDDQIPGHPPLCRPLCETAPLVKYCYFIGGLAVVRNALHSSTGSKVNKEGASATTPSSIAPEDDLLRHDARSTLEKQPSVVPLPNGFGPTEISTDPGAKRAKSRRRKSRASLSTGLQQPEHQPQHDPGERELANGGGEEWSNLNPGTREELTLADSSRDEKESMKRERRANKSSKSRKNAGGVAEAGEYPSLLDSRLWGGGEETRFSREAGGAGAVRGRAITPGLGGDLYEFA